MGYYSRTVYFLVNTTLGCSVKYGSPADLIFLRKRRPKGGMKGFPTLAGPPIHIGMSLLYNMVQCADPAFST